MGTNARAVGPLLVAVATELRVEAARQQLSLRELSRRSGVPYPTTRKSLEGTRAIDIEELALLAGALGVSVAVLVERAENALAATRRAGRGESGKRDRAAG